MRNVFKKMVFRGTFIVLLLPMLSFPPPLFADRPILRLATGSPYELGLVSALYQSFSKKDPCELRITEAGSEEALLLLKEGKVDMVIVHAPEAEMKAVKEGWALHRSYIGSNSFVIVGPPNDPADVGAIKTVVEAYQRIAKTGSLFFSRGDLSGTHQKEMEIWRRAKVKPKGSWYRVTHDFMMASLLTADEGGGYFMTDRSTYVVAKKKYPLKNTTLFEGDPLLINRYHAYAASPNINPGVNYEMAKKFIKFLTGSKGQKIVAEFGKKGYGEPLYFNASHRFGEVIIFHAGSLSVPFKKIAEAYEKGHEGVDVIRESSGSRKCARKIMDLKRPCDVIASADVEVITHLLFPEHANWCIAFATSQMVIAYTEKSRYASRIDPDNWFEILGREGVSFGYSSPELDPCGYRTLFVLQLAEKQYKRPGLYERLRKKGIVRPKSVELLGLLETGNLDYAFEYRSVAVQHGLKFVELPKEMNLGDPSLNDTYSMASIRLRGKKPGEYTVVRGRVISYGVSVLKDAPHRGFAEEFVEFLLNPEEGLKILRECGLIPIVPPKMIPERVTFQIR